MKTKRNTWTGLLLSAVALVLLSACSGPEGSRRQSRHEISCLMDSAQEFMDSNHRIAMDYIIGVDPQYIHSRKLNARYALLYSEALNLNRIPAKDDSLIMMAVRYYATTGDLESQFRAYYTLGCIYDDLNQPTDAAVALGQAEQLTSVMNDLQTGLLYSRFGKVYVKFYDYANARQYILKACDCYEKAGRTDRLINAYYDLACCYIDLLDFRTADSLLLIVEPWAEKYKDRRLQANSIVSRMACALYSGNNDSLRSVFGQYVSKVGEPRNDCSTLGLFALYHVKLKEFDKAQEYLQRAWGHVRSKSDAINLNYQNSALFENMGLIDSALAYHKRYVGVQTEMTREILGHPVLGAQKDYFKAVAEAETLRSSRNSRTIVLLSVSFVLAVVVLMVILRSRKLRFEADKHDLMLAIRELRLKEDSNSDTINQLGRQVNTLFSRQYAELDQVFDKMAELDEREAIYRNMHREGKGPDKTESFYKYIQSRLEDLKSEKNQLELDRIINSTYADLMVRLSAKEFGLNQEDMIILRLSISGFSVRTISRIMDISAKNIYQKRTRLLAKIEKQNAALSDEIASILKK